MKTKVTIGQRFNNLTVLGYSHTDNYPHLEAYIIFYKFKCDCGNEKIIRLSSAVTGRTKSCGCLQKKTLSSRVKTHGASETKEYWVWGSMIGRCTNPKNKAYFRYGGRGIGVCDRWLLFSNFIEDMGNRPTPEHTLERIDNDKGYCKENCKWATMIEQANNKSDSLNITYNGETKTLSQWCVVLGLKYTTVYSRLNTYGYSIEQAFTQCKNHRLYKL